MSTAPDDRLLRLAEVLSDGEAVLWDEVLRQEPDLGPALERLRQLQAIASAHETGAREEGQDTWRAPIKPPKTPLFSWGEIQVFEKLGEGAYAEVYRAWDPALEREVALKLTRSDAGVSATGVQRWVDEARRLARVRHPNVLVVHGVDVREGRAGFWTDLIHGQTLEQVLRDHGRLGDAEATLVGLDLCKALAAVHAVGLVHGDLKSSNVMREGGAGGAAGTGAGRIVLTDFGAAIESSPTPSRSAAFATPLTCAPEVLRGEPPTAASDLYSLGVLLYRLVAGRYPIESNDPTELEAKIQYGLRTPLRDLRPDIGTMLVAAVERALDPDPMRRFSSAGQMERVLGEALSETRLKAGRPFLQHEGAVEEVAPRLQSRKRRWLRIATVSAAVLMVALAWIAIERVFKRPSPPILFSISSPPGKQLRVDPNQFAISPDGTMLAFIAYDSTGQTLWVHRLGDLKQRELPGTSGVKWPFWSPDSKQVGFFADGVMKRVGLGGEDPQVICAASNPKGGSWGSRDVIVFSSGDGPLSRVPAAGGTPETVTQLDTTAGVNEHVWPSFLPDGQHFTYVARRKESFESGNAPKKGPWTSYVGSIRSMKAESLLTADGAPMYAAPGHLIFLRDGTLLAQSFDTRRRRLTGRPRQIAHSSGAVAFLGSRCGSVSTNGVLAWNASWSALGRGGTRLVWIDRNGARIGDVHVPSDRWTHARISPDGRHAILRREEQDGSNLWLLDLERETLRPLTQGPGVKAFGAWSPDLKEILYSLRGSDGVFDLRRITLDRPDSDRLFYRSRGELQNAHGWSRDGNVLAEGAGKETGLDLLLVPAQGGAPRPYLATRFNERGADIAPDGKWVVYLSNESASVLAYVQSFPKPGQIQQVSTVPLLYVRWSRKGREILLFAEDFRLRSVPVEQGAELRLGKPRELFSLPSDTKWLAPAPDGERFLMLEPAEQHVPGRSILVNADWMAGLSP